MKIMIKTMKTCSIMRKLLYLWRLIMQTKRTDIGFLRVLLLLLAVVVGLPVAAQKRKLNVNPEDRQVDMDAPTYVPMVKVGKVLEDGDSIQYVEMQNIYVYPPTAFKSEKQRQAFNRLVYNVKKVLPIAKECNLIIRETYEYLQTLPDKKSRDEHLRLVEEDIKRTYTPRMKKLTYSQGKLLIKLVDRECKSTSYGLIQAILGPVKAGFYQAFAWLYGASLKKHYDPEGVDRVTERVVRMVESGQL